MKGNRKNTRTKSDWVDPDDAPELDDAFFERAEIRHGDVLIKKGKSPTGRQPSDQPKQAVSLQLDANVIAHFKAGIPGWQTPINDALQGRGEESRKGLHDAQPCEWQGQSQIEVRDIEFALS